jgi:hypothetical protein
MPWGFYVDPGQRVSYLRLSGEVTFSDIVVARRHLAEDSDFDPAFPLLLDMRPVKDLRLTWPELKDVIARSPLLVSTRRAIVASSPNVIGVARIYERARKDQTATDSARVFQTLAEAASWLGFESLRSYRVR